MVTPIGWKSLSEQLAVSSNHLARVPDLESIESIDWRIAVLTLGLCVGNVLHLLDFGEDAAEVWVESSGEEFVAEPPVLALVTNATSRALLWWLVVWDIDWSARLAVAVRACDGSLELLSELATVGSSLGINGRSPERTADVGGGSWVGAVGSGVVWICRWAECRKPFVVDVEAAATLLSVTEAGAGLRVVAGQVPEGYVRVARVGGLQVLEDTVVAIWSRGTKSSIAERRIVHESGNSVWVVDDWAGTHRLDFTAVCTWRWCVSWLRLLSSGCSWWLQRSTLAIALTTCIQKKSSTFGSGFGGCGCGLGG